MRLYDASVSSSWPFADLHSLFAVRDLDKESLGAFVGRSGVLGEISLGIPSGPFCEP